MQFSESWLRTFCNPDIGSEELVNRLTMSGLEVEDSRPVAPVFSRVVVAEVVEVHPHPNADRLRVCQVAVGQASPLQIVCGAPNVKVGIKVPCALVGASLPSMSETAFEIKKSKLRGIESEGMLCSAKELGVLSESLDGLMVLPDTAPVGIDVRDYLKLDDQIHLLKLTPNLAHCLSMRGIAKEVAALTGAGFQDVLFSPVQPRIDEVVKVHIHDSMLCGRFSGRVVKGVHLSAKTPDWMIEKLARCGQRSVNALVDISNYVMFELGQPSHIFDLDQIHGDLHVRWAKPGELLELLNGQTIQLDEKIGVISDDHQVESLAGIMGGQRTAVSNQTKNIYIEAAFWWPQAIAGRSRRFHFSTEAGHRFERGVDPQQTIEAIERITQLVVEICGDASTVCGPLDDQILQLPERKKVRVRVHRVNRVLGMELSVTQMLDALARLELEPELLGDEIEIKTPSRRFDLNIEEDLIEEIVRMVGFQHLPSTPPMAPIVPRVIKEAQSPLERIKRHVAHLGYQETINFSFIDKQWERDLHGNANPIEVLNPIASQMSVMRSSLLGSLLNVVKYNLDHKVDSISAFEVGRVFYKQPSIQANLSDIEGIAQPMRIAGIRTGTHMPLQWGQATRGTDFFDVKADVESLFPRHTLEFKPDHSHPGLHPGRTARIFRDASPIGWIGEVHPNWRSQLNGSQSPVFFELDLLAVMDQGLPSIADISRFPSVSRDLSVVVSETMTHDALLSLVWSVDHQGLLKEVTLFDVYRPEQAGERGLQLGEKSMAIRLILNDAQATLTELQIDQVRMGVVDRLRTHANARLRD